SPALGVLTLVLDALKGSAAGAVGVFLSPAFFEHLSTSEILWRHLLPPSSLAFSPWAAMAAFFAVAGHIFPIWLHFRGGKGVATGLGAFLMIAPKSGLLCGRIFVVLVLVFRYVSLGSIPAVAAFPNIALVLQEDGNSRLALALMAFASVLI